VRLQKRERNQIKTLSLATFALVFWRSLIVGSRILAFLLFSLLFGYWLFVIIGFHYVLMFVLVFYQMRLTEFSLITKTVYNIVTPFVYVFDFCVNWLAGPSRYWYVMCYVPIFCENLLMSAIVWGYARTMPSPAWYVVPGCVLVIVMFPLGVLAQAAYYRYWHPSDPVPAQLEIQSAALENSAPKQTTWLQIMSWSEFRTEVDEANDKTNATTKPYRNPNKKITKVISRV